jgi:hypothetical protein
MTPEPTKRPRCKGTCGDWECEELERKWEAENNQPSSELLKKWSNIEEGDATIIESKETPYVPIVMIESPYAGDVERNLAYLRAALHDCLMRGEAPFASHGLYTQVLDDTVPEERDHGIQAGFAFREVSDYTVVYTDLGISPGMQLGIDHSHSKSIPVKFRTLPGWGKDEASTK